MSEIIDCIAYIVRKTCWSFYVFLKFLFLRLLDLLGLVLNLIACCTVLRFPFMIAQFLDMDSMREWRFIGLVQILIFLMDLPVIVMGLVILLTMWRVYPCIKDFRELKEQDGTYVHWKTHDIYFTGFDIRIIICKHFFTLFIDVFCVPSAIVALLSWRCVIFIRRMQKADSDWKRRKICFQECMQVLLDIPLIVCILITAMTWRLPSLVFYIRKDINKEKKWNKIRYQGIEQLFYFLLDIPCIIMSLILLISWRSPIVFWQLTGVEGNVYKRRPQFEIRCMILLQFLYIFCDIPAILAGLFIGITMWRTPYTYRNMKRSIKKQYNRNKFYKKEFKVRKILLFEFGMIFVDIVSFVLFVVLLATLWRVYPLITDMKKYLERYQKSNNHFDTHLHVEQSSNLRMDPMLIEETASREMTSKTLENTECSTTDEFQGEQEKVVSDDFTSTSQDNVQHSGIDENDVSDKDEKKPLSWEKCQWKIRKSILLNTIMLLVDIPAIPFSIFLLVTGIRTSAYISAVLGTGNFYMVFAITTYYQLFRFFIDLCFILLFLILMLLRPVQSWVHLLEDEEHKKYRLLCDYVLWIPDICVDRMNNYDALDEILLTVIKLNTTEGNAKLELDTLFEKHIRRLLKLQEKLQEDEIEEELFSLTEYVVFLERKRTGKLIRKFQLEKSYILRADAGLRQENLFKWNKEMREYNEAVRGAYDKLANYQPEKMPLYESKSGFSLRSRSETRKVLIRCLPQGTFVVTLMALVCILPLYRAPKMIRMLFKKWYMKYEIVTGTLKEYALDAIAVLRILIVLASVYRAPALIADIFDCLVLKRSWSAVRVLVKRYPADIMEDIVSLLGTLLSWKTPRFVITAVLFGVLMPADLFLTVANICSVHKRFSYLLTFILYVTTVASPLVFGLYGAERLLQYGLGWLNVVLLCVFATILLVILSLMVFSLYRDKKKTFLLEKPDCDYLRFSWHNIHVIVFEILEFFQGIALVFKFSSIPMYGGSVLQEGSQYLLFSFLPFKVVFWISASLFIIWFLLCAAPIIIENILEDKPISTCAKRPGWRLAISLFANTLFVTMMENFLSFSACKYETCPSNFTLGSIPVNSTCLTSVFVDNKSWHCWEGDHTPYAVFGLVALVWYSTTALIFGTKYGDPETTELDIGFSPIYNTFINILKAFIVVAVTLITNSNYTVVGLLIALNTSAILFTVAFRYLFGHQPCNLPSLLIWRVFTFTSCVISSIAVLVALLVDDSNSKVPLLIIGAGILVVFIIAVVVTLKLREISRGEEDRENFRKEILVLETKVQKNDWFHKKWRKENKMWRRLVKSVREARKNDRFVKPSYWRIPKFPNIGDETLDFDTKAVLNIQDYGSCKQTTNISDLERLEVRIRDETNSQSVDIIEEHRSQTEEEAGTSSLDIPPPPSYETQTKIPSQLPGIQSVPADVYRLEKNGRNLLLIMEKHIRYDAFKYAFVSQRNVWLNSVWKSNWMGLLEAVQILNSNIMGTFDKPTPLDVLLSKPSLPSDRLGEDLQDEQDPPKCYVKETKLMIEEKSSECRQRAVTNFISFPVFGNEWAGLFEKILPTHPVIKSWEYVESESFLLTTRRACTGTIVDIEEDGNKLAKGASFTIGKELRGALKQSGLSFDEGYEPVAKKGPVSIKIKSISIIQKNNELYLTANGKKIKYKIAFSSCKTIKWS